MANEITRIADLIENTFAKQPWYGSSMMEILKSVPPEIVNRKTGQAHSINELVLHMVAWREFATNRLKGDLNFQVTEEINFPLPGAWDDSLQKLHHSQEQLISAVKAFSEERLSEICPSKEYKYTYYTLLHGIAQHDVYHLGQIALLQKAFAR